MKLDEVTQRVMTNPKYALLKKTRSTYGWSMTALMMIAYFGYILLIAFNKEFLGQKIGNNVTSVGIPLGLGVILLTVALTWIYVRRANSEFDKLKDEVIAEAMSK